MIPLTILNLAIAFAAGILTFFAGCLAPIAPVYVGFLAGSNDGTRRTRRLIYTKNALLFTSGFLLVFLLLGYTASSLTRSIAVYRPIINRAAGVLLILFGLHLSKIITIPIFYKTRRLSFIGKQGTSLGSALLGITFGFAWTPCIGPVLAALLFWTGSQEYFLPAVPYLVLFSLGLGLPFVLLGIGFDTIATRIASFNAFAPLLNKASGTLLVLFGILLFSGVYQSISATIVQLVGSFAYILEFVQ